MNVMGISYKISSGLGISFLLLAMPSLAASSSYSPPADDSMEEELDPAYYEWLIDGSVEIYQEEEQEDDIELNEVELNSNNIEVSAGTDVMPIDFAVVAFHEVDSRGIPIDPIGDEFNCSVGSSECSVEEDNGRIIATLQIDAEPEIIVVHITYSAYDNVEEEARHMTGSWGARV